MENWRGKAPKVALKLRMESGELTRSTREKMYASLSACALTFLSALYMAFVRDWMVRILGVCDKGRAAIFRDYWCLGRCGHSEAHWCFVGNGLARSGSLWNLQTSDNTHFLKISHLILRFLFPTKKVRICTWQIRTDVVQYRWKRRTLTVMPLGFISF